MRHERRHALTAMLVVAMLAGGCLRAESPPAGQMERDTAALREVVPLLGERWITAFRNQDWCRNLAYGRGSFSTDNETGTCNLFNGPGEPFDAEAEAAFKVIEDALRDAGVNVYIVTAEIDESGEVTSAMFELDSPGLSGYWRYIYEPGAPMSADLDSELRNTRIDDDWYFQWEDWM